METIVTELQTRVNLLETKIVRMERAMKKMKKELMPETDKKPRPPSGFAKPTHISDEMCEFLGIPTGSELARTEVTKRVLAYVKDNELQNKENKRVIEVDDKLKALLRPADDEVVTYFSIQRLLKVHYPPKKEATVVAPASPPAIVTPDATKKTVTPKTTVKTSTTTKPKVSASARKTK
jgi:chromatin remodeling complex protein RSC6